MARFLYTVLLTLLLPFALLRLYMRGFRDPRYRQRWPERLGLIPAATGRTIWLHAVSVGEVRAAIPLINALLVSEPDCRLHITTTTPTGAETVEQLLGARVSHSYFPYDLPWPVRYTLKQLQPEMVLIMETEIWPNLFFACGDRGIPLYLINARLSEKSLQRYRHAGRLISTALHQVTLIAAKSAEDRERWTSLGVDVGRVKDVGNLKFDLSLDPATASQAAVWHSRWRNRRVWVAGSTHPGEDEQVLEAQFGLLKTHPSALLVLVPRHPEGASDVIRQCQQLKLNGLLASRANDLAETIQVVVADTIGELPAFYQACDVAFIGGSLVAHGGQNPLEAAVAGVPVLAGPCTENFADVYQRLAEAGAVITVRSSEELASKISDWFDNVEAVTAAGLSARAVVEKNKGATQRTLMLLKQ